MRIGCLAIVKNEARYIAEWIAFQLSIGFDSILIFNNGSTDQTERQIARFQPHHDVRLFPWPDTDGSFQRRAYDHGIQHFKNEFDWLAFFDADEFLVLNNAASL